MVVVSFEKYQEPDFTIYGKTENAMKTFCEWVAPVVEYDHEKDSPCINAMISFYNDGDRDTVISGLKFHMNGIVLLPELFFNYIGGNKVDKTEDSHAILVKVGEMQTIGIQFTAYNTDDVYVWPEGKYDFTLFAVINNDKKDFPGHSFSVELIGKKYRRVQKWLSASVKEWKSLGDDVEAVMTKIKVV